MKIAGAAELADFLGISKQALANIRKRGSVHGLGFPEPIAELRMSPIWDLDRPEMQEFATEYRKVMRGRVNEATV